MRDACDFPKGDPENPLIQEEVIRKFEDLTAGLLSDSEARAIAQGAMALENIPRVNLLFDGHMPRSRIRPPENS